MDKLITNKEKDMKGDYTTSHHSGRDKHWLQTPKNNLGVICTSAFRYHKHHKGKKYWYNSNTKYNEQEVFWFYASVKNTSDTWLTLDQKTIDNYVVYCVEELSEEEDQHVMTNEYPIFEWILGTTIDDEDDFQDMAEKDDNDSQWSP